MFKWNKGDPTWKREIKFFEEISFKKYDNLLDSIKIEKTISKILEDKVRVQ